MRKTLIASITILALAGGLATTAVHARGNHQGSPMEFGEPGKVSETSRTIEVLMWDNYFEPERIRVKAGETFRFVVRATAVLRQAFEVGRQTLVIGFSRDVTKRR